MKPIPLGLYARRLGPFVAAGVIPYAEAVDILMATAIERNDWTTGRLLDVEDWLSRRLAQEIDRADPALVARLEAMAAACKRGVRSVQEAEAKRSRVA